ncbi:hypothetical protein KR032_006122 [Drosophila birchii]|nr:hypothetical protein KR032_006122 [Drosophila birchii]
MESECCKCCDDDDEHIGTRKLDLSHTYGEFVSFLVVLPIALYAVFWHNSHLKPLFVVLAGLLLCEFIIFFEPKEMKDMFIETVRLVVAGLYKCMKFLNQVKGKIIEVHNNHLNAF